MQTWQLSSLVGGFIHTTVDDFASIGNTGVLPGGHITELGSAYPVRTAGAFSQLYCRILTNTGSATASIIFRIDFANGSQALSIPAGATGEFLDPLNLDTPALGQVVCVLLVGAVNVHYVINSLACVFNVINNAVNNTVSRIVAYPDEATATQSNTFARVLGSASQAFFGIAEAKCNISFRNACILQHLAVEVDSNAITNAVTVTLRKNAVDANLTVSIPLTSTGVFEDLVDSDVIASGDTLTYGINTGANVGSNQAALDFFSVEEVTTDGSFHCGGGENAPSVGDGNFIPICGQIAASSASESAIQFKVPVGGAARIRQLGLNITSNASSHSTSLTLRINGVNTGLSVSISTAATGLFTDTSHTASVVAGDELSLLTKLGGGEAWTMNTFWMNVIDNIVSVDALVSPADADYQWLGGDWR